MADLWIFKPRGKLPPTPFAPTDVQIPMSKMEQQDKIVQAMRLAGWSSGTDHLGVDWAGAGHVDFFVDDEAGLIQAETRFDRDRCLKFAHLFAEVGLAVLDWGGEKLELLDQPVAQNDAVD